MPRSSIVDYESPGYYHCISRCVRREALLKDPARRRWLLERMEFLARHLAIEIYAYAIMENHLHILIRIRPDLVRQWDDRQVASRRLGVLPRKPRSSPATGHGTRDSENPALRALLSSPEQLRKARLDLADPGFFHRLLKEPCARIWNKEDGVTGHFWEGRYKSPRVLDQESLLRVARYIDLNQIRACESQSIPNSVWTTARCQWNRLTSAIRQRSGVRMDDIAECARSICEIAWCPAFGPENPPGPTMSVVPADRRKPVPERPVPLVKYLLGLDQLGRQPRADKPGFIRNSSECSVRAAVARSVRKSRRRGKTAQLWMERWTAAITKAALETTAIAERLEPIELRPGSSRGSCYGGADQLVAEACRRGLKRVLSIAPL